MQTLLFTSLPAPQRRWKGFVLGWNLQALLLAGVLLATTQFQKKLADSQRYRITNLVSYESPITPEPEQLNKKLTNEPKPSLLSARNAIQVLTVRPQINAPSQPKPEPIAPALKIESKMPVLPTSENLKVVAMNTFSAGRPAMPNVVETPTAVQTGGFGAVHTASGPQDRSRAMIAPAGSFDSPVGTSNGRGPAGSTLGSVMSAGFGGQSAAGGQMSAGRVQQSGFDAHPSDTKPETIATVLPTTPVEIIFKPRPDYTDEARELRISGEVRLQVLFNARGQVRVISVLQGLGHGLDEKAIRAAEQIQFKPALHAGEPVDSTAVVHIVFDLVG
jgi:TonB family protein